MRPALRASVGFQINRSEEAAQKVAVLKGTSFSSYLSSMFAMGLQPLREGSAIQQTFSTRSKGPKARLILAQSESRVDTSLNTQGPTARFIPAQGEALGYTARHTQGLKARLILAAAAAIVLTSTITAQQLPAGARDATDNSRAEAAAARLREAESALERGDYAAAAPLLRTLADEHPKDPHILYDLGFAEERTGAEPAAAAAYASAAAADPTFPEPRLALGLLDARAGRTDKAHAELAAVAQQTSASPALRARALRALAGMDELDHPADAREALLAAVKLTGETPEDIALSAALAARAGDAPAAEAAFRRALQLHPDDVDAAVGLARLLDKAGKSAEAQAVLAEPLKSHPDDPRLISQMASILAASGQAKAAIPLLLRLRADAKFAADPALTRQLARLYAIDGQNAEAEQMYRSVLSADPTNAPLLDDLGSVLVRQQKYPEAEAVLARAVSLRDKFPTPDAFGEAAGHLAFAASKAGHPQVALRALTLRATVLPDSASALFLQATAHDTLHQYKEAARSYKAFLAIAGNEFPDQEFQARHRLLALDHMK
jgi:Flp pilus assembly protein TadD